MFVVLGSLTIILGISSLILFFQNRLLRQQIASSQSSPSPIPTVSSDLTTNWSTYLNLVYGYQFKYPGSLTGLDYFPELTNSLGKSLVFFTKHADVEKSKDCIIDQLKESGNYPSSELDISSSSSCTENALFYLQVETLPNKDLNSLENKYMFSDTNNREWEIAHGKLTTANGGVEYRTQAKLENHYISIQTFKNALQEFRKKEISDAPSPARYVLESGTVEEHKELVSQILSSFEFNEPSRINGWNSYVDYDLGFGIQYPNKVSSNQYSGDWEYSEKIGNSVSFGTPDSKSGGYIFGVYVTTDKSLEELIADDGKQFDDRKETRESITVDDHQAILVTVTTNELPDWISKQVFIQKDSNIYTIGNGATGLPEFDIFYKSFKFTN